MCYQSRPVIPKTHVKLPEVRLFFIFFIFSFAPVLQQAAVALLLELVGGC